MHSRRLLRVVFAAGLALAVFAPTLASPPAASADSCYTWSRTLRRGASGPDVRQLQIRVGGWAAYKDHVGVDGVYGAETENAVKRFQRAYGLRVDGVAGSQTYNKIYALQDGDCSPAHFAWSEFDDKCFGGFSGGKVSSAKVKSNVLRVMWRLEALRKKLGGTPVIIVSGFRSVECNRRASGASNSQHMYGTAADLRSSSASLCQILYKARTSGFSSIIGPGSPDGNHNDHIHVDIRAENNDDGISNSYYWPYTRC